MCELSANPFDSGSSAGGMDRCKKRPGGRASKDQQIALRTFAITWAGVQVHAMEKMDTKRLHVLMRGKYDDVASNTMSLKGIPGFWGMMMLTCSDLEGKKLPEDDGCMWRLYKRNKAEFQNMDSHAVARAAARMQIKKVPSGKGTEFWTREVLYKCWCAEHAEPGSVDTGLGGST